MPRYHTISRALVAAAAIAALTAPGAVAKPIGGGLLAEQRAAQAAEAAQHSDAGIRDARSPDAKDAATPAATSTLPGPPTWPMHPRPIQPPQVEASVDDDGTPWAAIGLGLAGTIALGGAAAAVGRTRRTRVAV